MAKHIGVEWAERGWLGVILHDDGWDADVFPSIMSLWKYHSDARRVLVDVPVGLPSVDSGRRTCDVEAKAYLEDRHRSVFYAPVREAVYETNLADAKAATERAGYGIQPQAWRLVPRMREVDEFLDLYPGARGRVRETHPEVCFRSLTDGPLAHPRRSADGRDERRAILREQDAVPDDICEAVRSQFDSPSYAPSVASVDDVLAAVVAAVTAQRSEDELSTLPDRPPTDERGLPMEIVHPSPAVQTTLSALS